MKKRSDAMQAMHEAVHGVRWDARVQTADESRRMRAYIRFAERNNGGPIIGMCKTCAFRPDTEANQSATVLEFIETSLVLSGKFGCHAGATVNPANGCTEEGTEPNVPCRGFAALAGAVTNSTEKDDSLIRGPALSEYVAPSEEQK
jgi:hypothetical protein